MACAIGIKDRRTQRSELLRDGALTASHAAEKTENGHGLF